MKSILGIPIDEAMSVLKYYKKTGEKVTEQYVKGYAAGFNDCDKMYKEVFLKMNFEGAESVEFKKFDGSYRLKKTSDKTSDNGEVNDGID